jgi:hypothetical protein
MTKIPFRTWPSLGLSALFMLACSTSFADGPSSASPSGKADFAFEKTLSAPTKIEIIEHNGPIRVEPGAGDVLEVVAYKSGRREDFDRVSIVSREEGGTLVFCVLPPGETPAACRPGGELTTRNGDEPRVRVEIRARVPSKVSGVTARTMNGEIVARSPGGDVTLRTMNGTIAVSAKGPIDASTMNGKIVASATSGQPVKLETKNGEIELVASGAMNADVEASTMNGHVTSDFGAVPPPSLPRIHDAKFRIGTGGTPVSLHTMNGDVRVRRAP